VKVSGQFSVLKAVPKRGLQPQVQGVDRAPHVL